MELEITLRVIEEYWTGFKINIRNKNKNIYKDW